MSENFEKLELTPRNVYRIMQECKKTDATERIRRANFYAIGLQHLTPTLELDAAKLNKYKDTIRYMVGQLHAVHANKETMIPSYGSIDYKGRDWTNKDNLALFSLYYLATASPCIPPFEKGINGGVACRINNFINLKPTFWPPEPE